MTGEGRDPTAVEVVPPCWPAPGEAFFLAEPQAAEIFHGFVLAKRVSDLWRRPRRG